MWQQCTVWRVQTLNVSKIFWHCREKENTLIQVCVSLPLTAIEVCYCTDWSKCRVCSLRQQVNGFLYRHGYSISRECTLKETKYWNIYINSLLLVFLVTRTVSCTPFTPSHIYFTTSHFWKPCCYNLEASVSFSSVQYRVSPRKLVSRGVLSKCLSYINIIR